MQCHSCAFHNTPGMPACVRCGSALDFAGVDVTPPRAPKSPAARRARAAASALRLGAVERAAAARASIRRALNPDVDWPALLRAVVPGWGHAYVGQRRIALAAAAVWLAILLTGLALAGGPAAWFCYFALVGWHGTLISLLLSRPLSTQPLLRRALVGLLIVGFLNAALYLPGRWAVRNVAAAAQLNGIAGSDLLRSGDTIIHTGAWTRPASFRRGDLVFYRIARAEIPGAVLRAGYGVDRIVAVPGDTVVLDKDLILVNGRPPAPDAGPIAPIRWPLSYESTLDGSTYLIIPSALRLDGFGDGHERYAPQAALAASLVTEDELIGRVLWRLRPFGRAGPIRPARPAAAPAAGAAP